MVQNGTLNPVTDTDSINAMLREALYEGLFELTDDFTPQNVLCEGYSGDGTTFTFTLRQGVKFWSGQTLTADDVVASYRAAMDNASSPYHSRLADVTTLESAGTYKVRIVLSSPNADFPRLLNIPVYRRGSADSGSFADGTGPYVPVENGSAYTLEKNENWHDGFLGTIRHIELVGTPGRTRRSPASGRATCRSCAARASQPTTKRRSSAVRSTRCKHRARRCTISASTTQTNS